MFVFPIDSSAKCRNPGPLHSAPGIRSGSPYWSCGISLWHRCISASHRKGVDMALGSGRSTQANSGSRGLAGLPILNEVRDLYCIRRARHQRRAVCADRGGGVGPRFPVAAAASPGRFARPVTEELASSRALGVARRTGHAHPAVARCAVRASQGGAGCGTCIPGHCRARDGNSDRPPRANAHRRRSKPPLRLPARSAESCRSAVENENGPAHLRPPAPHPKG